MGAARAKKQRWFDLGVEAISRVTGERIPGYVCPLCSRPWSSVEDVSFEHAPPRGLGGRTIALTCRECNSTSGFNLDAELHKAERIRKWDRGQLAEPLRARASIAGLPPLNVDLHRDPDLTTRSLGVPARNDPAITAAHVAWSQAGLESGEPSRDPVHVALPWFRERRARIALLRSAYIVAFALLGYRYALRPQLQVVRDQIELPDEPIIDRFFLQRGEDMDRRVAAWVEKPRSLESVVVQIDHYLIFLPGLKISEPGIYERLATRRLWPPPARSFRAMSSTPFGWPTRPEHRFDTVDRLTVLNGRRYFSWRRRRASSWTSRRRISRLTSSSRFCLPDHASSSRV